MNMYTLFKAYDILTTKKSTGPLVLKGNHRVMPKVGRPKVTSDILSQRNCLSAHDKCVTATNSDLCVDKLIDARNSIPDVAQRPTNNLSDPDWNI